MIPNHYLAGLNTMHQAQLARGFAQTRGVWLRSSSLASPSALRLMSSSRFAGMHLEVLGFARLPVIPFWRYDLIVLEQEDEEATPGMIARIRRVRALSSAPLVVLTRRPQREVTLAGLNAGADAVTSLLTQERVLLAHWGAMLQRWKAA